MINLKEY